MRQETGISPYSKSSISSDELFWLKSIISEADVAEIGNEFVHQIVEVEDITRFRNAFTRYLKKYNEGAGTDKKFKIASADTSNQKEYRIWRIK